MPLFSFGGKGSKDPMVDLENLLIDYAWTELSDARCMDQVFKTRRYTFEVNWTYVNVSHRIKKFLLRHREDSGHSLDPRVRAKVIQRDLCLFRTEFTNSSPSEQSFTFKTERKTTSRCDVSIQRGFRLGANVDVRLSIPIAGGHGAAGAVAGEVEGCRITGGLSGELHVTKTTGQTFEETLTWGVDSQVKVGQGSRVVAELIIREEEMTADFEIENTFEAINDVPVYVKDRKTGRVLEVLEIPKQQFAKILRMGEGIKEIDASTVSCVTNGTLRAVYGAEQVISVKSFQGNHPPPSTVVEFTRPQIQEV